MSSPSEKVLSRSLPTRENGNHTNVALDAKIKALEYELTVSRLYIRELVDEVYYAEGLLDKKDRENQYLSQQLRTANKFAAEKEAESSKLHALLEQKSAALRQLEEYLSKSEKERLELAAATIGTAAQQPATEQKAETENTSTQYSQNNIVNEAQKNFEELSALVAASQNTANEAKAELNRLAAVNASLYSENTALKAEIDYIRYNLEQSVASLRYEREKAEGEAQIAAALTRAKDETIAFLYRYAEYDRLESNECIESLQFEIDYLKNTIDALRQEKDSAEQSSSVYVLLAYQIQDDTVEEYRETIKELEDRNQYITYHLYDTYDRLAALYSEMDELRCAKEALEKQLEDGKRRIADLEYQLTDLRVYLENPSPYQVVHDYHDEDEEEDDGDVQVEEETSPKLEEELEELRRYKEELANRVAHLQETLEETQMLDEEREELEQLRQEKLELKNIFEELAVKLKQERDAASALQSRLASYAETERRLSKRIEALEEENSDLIEKLEELHRTERRSGRNSAFESVASDVFELESLGGSSVSGLSQAKSKPSAVESLSSSPVPSVPNSTSGKKRSVTDLLLRTRLEKEALNKQVVELQYSIGKIKTECNEKVLEAQNTVRKHEDEIKKLKKLAKNAKKEKDTVQEQLQQAELELKSFRASKLDLTSHLEMFALRIKEIEYSYSNKEKQFVKYLQVVRDEYEEILSADKAEYEQVIEKLRNEFEQLMEENRKLSTAPATYGMDTSELEAEVAECKLRIAQYERCIKRTNTEIGNTRKELMRMVTATDNIAHVIQVLEQGVLHEVQNEGGRDDRSYAMVTSYISNVVKKLQELVDAVDLKGRLLDTRLYLRVAAELNRKTAAYLHEKDAILGQVIERMAQRYKDFEYVQERYNLVKKQNTSLREYIAYSSKSK